MNTPMSKEKAIKILEQVTAQLKLSREEHALILKALRFLATNG